MPYYHVKDFVRGLDTRRMVETTEPGSLIAAKNCVITRGGEIERRKAWNKIKNLPANTYGLYALDAIGGDFHVWGTIEDPGMPPAVTYHRIQHPDGEEISLIKCVKYIRKKFFVIAQFQNGDVLAFYDDIAVVEDPRPPEQADPDTPPAAVENPNPVGGNRSTAVVYPFRNVDNTAVNIVKISAWRQTGDLRLGTGSWEIYKIYDGTLTIPATADANEFCELAAEAINGYTPPSGPDFNAKASEGALYVSFADEGEQYNGMTLLTNQSTFPYVWDAQSGSAIFGGGTDSATGQDVSVDPPDPDPDPDPIPTPDPVIDPYYTPGIYALQHAAKVFAVGGASSLLRASAINAPDLWAIDAAGAGYIDFSLRSGRSAPNLTSLGVFQGNLAIFAGKTIYVWRMDPDLAQSQELYIVENTGTYAPNSVTEYGNTDVFYLDRSGIRSLQSRELTGAAFSSDIGNPIDEIVREQVETLGFYIAWASGVVDPDDGRYVLALGNYMYVFTYFAKTKIAAWTFWDLGFFIENLVSNSSQMFCRSRDAIYAYGSFPVGYPEYDACEVEVQLPYLAAGKPATQKNLHGLDIAVENTWTVEMGVDYTDPTLLETIGTIGETTFREQRVALQGYATHASFKLTCTSDGYARLGSLIWHFTEGESPG